MEIKEGALRDIIGAESETMVRGGDLTSKQLSAIFIWATSAAIYLIRVILFEHIDVDVLINVSDRKKLCNPLVPPESKYFISQKWIQGSYQQRKLRGQREQLMPWLQLTSDKLWWSGGNMLFGFDRQEQTHKKTNIFSCDKTFPKNNEHIGRFILWRDYIVNGNKDGSIILHTEAPVENKYNGWNECIIKKRLIIHNNPISTLDATSNVIVSAADSECAIIRVEDSLHIDSINTDNIIRKKTFTWKIHSLAINPLGTVFSGYIKEDLNRIFYIDIERDSVFQMFVTSLFGETRDMLWEDSNTLLTCGPYHIKKWDFRIEEYVNTWQYGPKYGEIYCISSDHHNTMITGTDNSSAVLWDQRMPNFVQMYSMPAQFENEKCDSISPIYSLRFDSTKLYCASDRVLYELDFSK